MRSIVNDTRPILLAVALCGATPLHVVAARVACRPAPAGDRMRVRGRARSLGCRRAPLKGRSVLRHTRLAYRVRHTGKVVRKPAERGSRPCMHRLWWPCRRRRPLMVRDSPAFEDVHPAVLAGRLTRGALFPGRAPEPAPLRARVPDRHGEHPAFASKSRSSGRWPRRLRGPSVRSCRGRGHGRVVCQGPGAHAARRNYGGGARAPGLALPCSGDPGPQSARSMSGIGGGHRSPFQAQGVGGRSVATQMFNPMLRALANLCPSPYRDRFVHITVQAPHRLRPGIPARRWRTPVAPCAGGQAVRPVPEDVAGQDVDLATGVAEEGAHPVGDPHERTPRSLPAAHAGDVTGEVGEYGPRRPSCSPPEGGTRRLSGCFVRRCTQQAGGSAAPENRQGLHSDFVLPGRRVAVFCRRVLLARLPEHGRTTPWTGPQR